MSNDDIVIDDLYDGYELHFVDDDTTVELFCTRCESFFGTMTRNDIESLETKTLYERIIDIHRDAGTEL